MLPDPYDVPSFAPEPFVRIPITPLIVGELFRPESGVRLRPGRMFRAPVPEAPVHEDGDAFRPEYDVRSPPHAGNDRTV